MRSSFKRTPWGLCGGLRQSPEVETGCSLLGASLMGLEDGAGPCAEGLLRGWGRKRGVKGSLVTSGLEQLEGWG